VSSDPDHSSHPFLRAPSKLPVSVCILCKNEEDRLDNCLGALEGFAEVIVMDTGSTDGSMEVIKNYPEVTLLEEPWLGFAASRRSLFKKASQPWVLWLDADEVVTPELKYELHELFCGLPSFDAFEINRIVKFEGQWIKHGLWFPDWNLRLFKQGKWNMPEREVHESIRVEGDIGRLKHLLWHFTYRNWDDQRHRSLKYAKLWAKQKQKDGKKARLNQIWIHSSWTFFRSYILKKGLLDGMMGLKIAVAVAREVHQKYSMLYALNHGKSYDQI
jgi:hypothetical protein